jgi:hypothetical protein
MALGIGKGWEVMMQGATQIQNGYLTMKNYSKKKRDLKWIKRQKLGINQQIEDVRLQLFVVFYP